MKSSLKILILLLLFFICCFQDRFAQTEIDPDSPISLDDRLHIGDEFTYLVKYAFLNLGEIKTSVISKEVIDGRTIYKAMAYIDSYDGLPFVDIHQTYESWFDSTFFPIYFKAFNFTQNDTFYTNYRFMNNDSIYITKGNLRNENPSRDTTIHLAYKCQDGLSLLYYSRFMSQPRTQISIPCFINEDTAMTKIKYGQESESISTDEIDYDMNCFRIDGNIGFTGVFGLTGDFTGWFTDDQFKVPVYADLQVLIGDISIELLDWNRENWLPPVSE